MTGYLVDYSPPARVVGLDGTTEGFLKAYNDFVANIGRTTCCQCSADAKTYFNEREKGRCMMLTREQIAKMRHRCDYGYAEFEKLCAQAEAAIDLYDACMLTLKKQFYPRQVVNGQKPSHCLHIDALCALQTAIAKAKKIATPPADADTTDKVNYCDDCSLPGQD